MKDMDLASTATIDIAPDLSLRYLKVGSGPLLVLPHTIRTELAYFGSAIPQLTPHFTVYALDLPGHGRSDIERGANYTEPYFRNAVRRFIEQLDLSDVTLAGDSIGGVLALTVASEIPSRVRAVVASNPYDYDRFYGDGVRRGNLLANIVIGSFQIPIAGAIVATLENPLILGPILRGGLVDKRKLRLGLLMTFDWAGHRWGFREVERKTFAGWRSWSAARELYPSVRAPVVLVYGERDWSTDAERQRNANEIPGVRLITLPNSGHFTWLERPEALASIVKSLSDETHANQPTTKVS